MADERATLEGRKNPISEGCRWADLAAPQMEDAKLEAHYRYTLDLLRKQGGMLGLIFRKTQNKDPGPGQGAPTDRGADRQPGGAGRREGETIRQRSLAESAQVRDPARDLHVGSGDDHVEPGEDRAAAAA